MNAFYSVAAMVWHWALTVLVAPSSLYAITTILSIASLTTCGYRVYNDYLLFLSLGPGGTPSTATGYLRTKLLGLFALRDPFSPPQVRTSFGQGYLTSLPKRGRPRPIVAGIAPQRQLTQRSGSALFSRLRDTITALATTRPDLKTGTSCFEKNNIALFTTVSAPRVRTCRGEIAHAHPLDGSLHVTLHPADIRTVLEADCGERHPLAREGRVWDWCRLVPREFVLVYAPLEEKELDIIEDIVRAAVWYVGGDLP